MTPEARSVPRCRVARCLRVLPCAIVAVAVAPRMAAAQEVASDAVRFMASFRWSGLATALFVIAAAVLLVHIESLIMNSLGNRFSERRLLFRQANALFRFIVFIITFSLVVRALFHLDQQTMLALTGTIAVAVGFALKDVVSSVVAGVIILFDRPFQVGDRVTFGGLYGEITAIGLRSVRMVTLDDSTVTIPNNKFLTEVVVSANVGALNMQVVMDFFVAPETDIALAKRIVYEAIETSTYVYLEKPVVVLVKDLIHNGYVLTRLRGRAYVLDVRYEKAFETDVTERVKQGFAAAQISPPRQRHDVRSIEG